MTTGAPPLASPRPSPRSLYPRAWSCHKPSLCTSEPRTQPRAHKTPVFLHSVHTPLVPQYAARPSLAPASPNTVPATEVYKHEGPRPENRFSLHRPFRQRPTSPDSLRRNPRRLAHTAHFQQPYHRNQYVCSSPSPPSSLLSPRRLHLPSQPSLPLPRPPQCHPQSSQKGPRHHDFFFSASL